MGHGCRDFRGPRSVAVDAYGLRVQSDFGPVAGNYRSAFHDVQRLASGFAGVADQRVVEFARAQSAIWLVAAVGEGFGGNGEAGFSKDIEHRRSSQAHEHNVATPASDALSNRFGNLAIANRLIVKRAVRLDVH